MSCKENHDHDHSHDEKESGHFHGHDDCGHDATGLPRGLLVTLSGVFTALGLLWRWLKWSPAAGENIAFALATLAGGLIVFPAAWNALRKGRLDINVLMTAAVIGAWIIGEGAEAASVVFLFAFSELLESWSARRARRAVASLLEITPATALRQLPDGSTTEIAVNEIAVGDSILIRSGARVPLDGSVLSGASSVNQAPITGESVPVEKKAGDQVFAGTINGEGSLTVQVTKLSGDSTLARIIQMVEEAEEQKAPTQRFVDRFAQYYTPITFVVALLIALVPPLFFGGAWSLWVYRALVLLVIACPCALVIATPVSIVSGLTALARRGVLVKGGAYLETIGKLRALAVDKTGTITQGKPRVVEVIPLAGQTEEEILALAAAIDAHSEHPLAQAVVNEAKARGVSFTPAENYENKTGRGALGTIQQHPHFVGNHRMTHDIGACSTELEAKLAGIEERGLSLTVVGHQPHDSCEARALGIIVIGDTLRPESREAVKILHESGLEKIIMLSGDNQRTADAISRQAGIDHALGDLLPEQKVEQIQKLVREYQHVGMIGDGVNDAPALALASVGIAMGAIGSDTAIETADVALMKDDLRGVAEAIRLGRRTVSIIQFNVAFALVIKAVFLLLAFTGKASLWMAILADTGATILVILNALRLLRADSDRHAA